MAYLVMLHFRDRMSWDGEGGGGGAGAGVADVFH